MKRAGREWRQARVIGVVVGVAVAGVLRVRGDRKSPPHSSGCVGDGEEPFCSCGLSLSENAAC